MSLAAYRHKRTFAKTPEPQGRKPNPKGPLTFVIQKHHASRLHYDFRLELQGVLKSWAVPKGPSLNPHDKRLAMMVEDHPMDYANFEGIIPKGNYGAGTVMVWDAGVYSPLASVERNQAEKILLEQLKKGHLTFVLLGKKLHGEFALIKAPRLEENAWLLIKTTDEYSSTKDILEQDRSILSGRSMDEIANQAAKKHQLWFGKPKNIDLSGVPKGPMPHQIKPMLAETVEEPFDKRDWIFEIKWDGYRTVAEIESGKVQLYSRNHLSYNQRFAPVVKALSKFPGSAVLDGEIVVLDSAGHASFQLLQEYPKGDGELFFYVFDLLYFDGYLLEQLPLVRRKEILRQVLPPLPHLRYGDYVAETGKAFFSVAKKLHLEGIIAKHAESTYQRGERSHQWLKIKKSLSQEAVIAGFTKPKGSRQHFGALVLGIYKRGVLQYIGHTGGGFDDQNLAAVYKKLKPLIQDQCPFSTVPKTNTPVTWVKPLLTCEVTFKEWTKDHKLRHPIFLGLREDKNLSEATPERVAVTVDKQELTLTHLTKVFWPTERYTKADLLYYYNEISPVLLPYLKDRPQSLLRFPDGIEGEHFFQKETDSLHVDWIKRETIRSESEGKTVHYLLCQDKASLMYIINLGCIDFNPWSSRIGHLDKPDYLILDLDPEKVRFEQVVQVALTARAILENVDIESFCKTSGKRGFHIYIPTHAVYSYDQVRQFAQLLCLQIQKKLPDLVSLKRNPHDRQGKVYLDYLRNSRGQTAASVYSVRAYPHATVSTPLLWKEVTKRLNPDQFTMKSVPKRIDKIGDIFSGVLGKGFTMEKALKKFIV